MQKYRRSDFTFPTEKINIAEYPSENPKETRLMIVKRESGEIIHDTFDNLKNYLNPHDLVVYNDTGVFPGLLDGTKEDEKVEAKVFLLRELQPEMHLWDAIVSPARKIRIGNKLFFGHGLIAEIVDNTTSKGRTIRFLDRDKTLRIRDIVNKIGYMPLPPYIKRPSEDADREHYQTIFAKDNKSVVASFAALHFTESIIETLKDKEIDMVPITLQISWGTFRRIEVEDMIKHRLDNEYYEITEESCDAVKKAQKTPDTRVVACGLSVVRTLESNVMVNGLLKANIGWTNKFIYPPYNFSIVDSLLTTFHQPHTPMLMMIAAFGGFDLILKAYNEAVKENYRFYAFGDSMLII